MKLYYHKNRSRVFPLFLIVLVLLAGVVSALPQPPLLVSADATSATVVSITFRNNDISVDSIDILRQEETGNRLTHATVVSSATGYQDKSCKPSTFYTYALRGATTGGLTELSNMITVQTPAIPSVFVKPDIKLEWNESSQLGRIFITDNATDETGYKIERKLISGTWEVVADIKSVSPTTQESIEYTDTTCEINRWYAYRVSAYKTGQSLVSLEAYLFSYLFPSDRRAYTFTKVSAFPVQSPAWIEHLGDSLFLAEFNSAVPRIAVVDISDLSNPTFRSYSALNAISPALAKTPIGVRSTLGYNADRNSFSDFYHSDGYYFIQRGNFFCLYDSVSLLLLDSLKTDLGSVIGKIDSMTFVTSNYGTKLSSFTISGKKITENVGLNVLTLISSRVTQGMSVWGLKKMSIIYISTFKIPESSKSFTYRQAFFSRDEDKYYQYSKTYNTEILFDNALNVQIDSTTVITCSQTAGISLYAFNIGDNHAGADANSHSHYDDIAYAGGTPLILRADTALKQVYVVGEQAAYIYSYKQSVEQVDSRPRYPHKKIISCFEQQGKLLIVGLVPQKDQITICNLNGRLIKKLRATESNWALWDKKDLQGRLISKGTYIISVRSNQTNFNQAVTIVR